MMSFLPHYPLVSIVTPSFNQSQYLEQTILSVLQQDYPAIEYIIIDGGSTDGSVDIIRRYEDRLAYWVSEPDKGQSHALNKGFAKTTGEILAWQNADDFYEPGAIATAITAYKRHPGSIIAGHGWFLDETTGDRWLKRPYGITFANMVKFWEGKWSWIVPAILFPRKAYLESGGFDENLHYVMDHDLFCRLLQRCSVVYVKDLLATFRLHPESKSGSRDYYRFILEESEAVKQYWSLLPEVDRAAHDQWVAQFLVHQAARMLRRADLRRAMTIYKESLHFGTTRVKARALLHEVTQAIAYFRQLRRVRD